MPEVEQVATTQGTRLSETPPWMSYAAEFEEKLDSKLQSEVDDYSQKRHEKSSTENEEELCRWKEENQNIAKEYQWLHPDEYIDDKPRIGRVLTHQHFINKLREHCTNRKFWYKQHPQPDKATLLWGDGLGFITPDVACWVQVGYMPEYSIMRFDEHGVPLDERLRGWRTCLLQMILKGVITEKQAVDIFGEAHGPASERYLSTLYAYRNRNNGG